MSFANATLAFSTCFKGTIFQILLPELSEMLGLCARKTRKPASLGYKCQKITNPATYSSLPDISVPFHFCQIDVTIKVIF